MRASEHRQLGKYDLRGIQGRGAMGTVYEAWDSVLARRVAIKTVTIPEPTDPEAREALVRFRREAQAAGMLNHPNIVAIHDYGETDDMAYIVMEFVDGDPLKAQLDRGERLPPETVATLMRQLLDGLGFSHKQGVVHRDIKPGNIMLTRTGTVKITDFGIARIESSSVTQHGTLLGTPAYMSPEQFMGQASDLRTDIYSAGALLFQLLTGRRPFEGTTTAIMHRVLNSPPPKPSALSPVLAAFDAVVGRAMAKDPALRYQSAAEMDRAIAAAFAGTEDRMPDAEATLFVGGPGDEAAAPGVHGVVEDDTVTWTMPPRPAGWRGKGGWIAGGIGVAVLGGFGWLIAGQEPAAAVDLAALRGAVAGVECTLSNPQVGADGTVFVTGLAPKGRPEAGLRQAVGGVAGTARVAWSLTGFDGPYCEALNVLRPMRGRDVGESAALRVMLKGNVTRLRQGDRAVLQVVMPGFPAHLQIDYLSEDGSIAHLLNDDGTSQVVLAKEGIRRVGPSHRYKPGEVVTIGESDTQIGFNGWEIDGPYGTDMIVVVASEAPLRRVAPPAEDTAALYFRDLRAALEAAEGAGEAVSAEAILLETVMK